MCDYKFMRLTVFFGESNIGALANNCAQIYGGYHAKKFPWED